MRIKIKFIVYWLIPIFCFTSCASNHKATEGQPKIDASLQNEFEVGQKIHQEILASFRPYTEPDAVQYVNDIARNLAKQTERKELPYEVTLLYNDRLYATSAPGGRIYLTTGFIYFLSNEAELAAVIAHELGELQFKNPNLSHKNEVLNQMLQGGTMMAPMLGQFGVLAALGLVMVKAVADGKQVKPEDKLTLADRKALHYMTSAGYDPQGMMDLMYRFLEAKPETIPYFKDYYDARPITQARMDAMKQTYAELPLQNQSFSSNRDHFLEMTKGVREIYRQAS